MPHNVFSSDCRPSLSSQHRQVKSSQHHGQVKLQVASLIRLLNIHFIAAPQFSTVSVFVGVYLSHCIFNLCPACHIEKGDHCEDTANDDGEESGSFVIK